MIFYIFFIIQIPPTTNNELIQLKPDLVLYRVPSLQGVTHSFIIISHTPSLTNIVFIHVSVRFAGVRKLL